MTFSLLQAENTIQDLTVDPDFSESVCKLVFPTVVQIEGTSISLGEAGSIILEPDNTYSVEAKCSKIDSNIGKMVVVTIDSSIISNPVAIGETVNSTISVSSDPFTIYIGIFGDDVDGTITFPSSINDISVIVKTLN